MSKVSKVIYAGETIIDLTSDTVDEEHLLKGITAHDKAGNIIEGKCTFDSDTSSDTATAAEILSGKTAHARKVKTIGTMPNNGAVTGNISGVTDIFTIPQGYHDGSGKVSIDTDEQAKIVAKNIRAGVTLLGIEGSMTGTEDVKAEKRTVAPSNVQQSITPGEGYNYLSEVIISAIKYVVTDNAAGGQTVSIG